MTWPKSRSCFCVVTGLLQIAGLLKSLSIEIQSSVPSPPRKAFHSFFIADFVDY